jgi:AP2 domain
MKQIDLSRGLFALVDDEDHDSLSEYKWSVKPSPGGHRCPVANIKVNGSWKLKAMHRLIMGEPLDREVIFMNHDGLDCRRSNLKVVTHKEAQRYHRVRRDSETGIKGVTLEPSGMWYARIQVNGNPIHVGSYETEEIAKKAYDRALKEHFGAEVALHSPAPGGSSTKETALAPVPPAIARGAAAHRKRISV